MQELLALASYALVSSITPGPNNIMLAASGVSFGFKRTIPHMLGIPFGFAVQLALCAYGLGAFLMQVPAANMALKIFGSSYLLYLAWTLRENVTSSDSKNAKGKPMTFINAALFQFANPKAWVMAITGASVFLPSFQPLSLAIVILCLIFCLINLPCITVWTLLGTAIRTCLSNPIWQKSFSAVIVILTLYAAIAIWF